MSNQCGLNTYGRGLQENQYENHAMRKSELLLSLQPLQGCLLHQLGCRWQVSRGGNAVAASVTSDASPFVVRYFHPCFMWWTHDVAQ